MPLRLIYQQLRGYSGPEIKRLRTNIVGCQGLWADLCESRVRFMPPAIMTAY